MQNWYSVELIFQILQAETAHKEAQFDLQVRLVQAKNTASAMHLAHKIAQNESCSFVNMQGETVSWKFIAIRHLVQLNTSLSGCLVYQSTLSLAHSALFIAACLAHESQVNLLTKHLIHAE